MSSANQLLSSVIGGGEQLASNQTVHRRQEDDADLVPLVIMQGAKSAVCYGRRCLACEAKTTDMTSC